MPHLETPICWPPPWWWWLAVKPPGVFRDTDVVVSAGDFSASKSLRAESSRVMSPSSSSSMFTVKATRWCGTSFMVVPMGVTVVAGSSFTKAACSSRASIFARAPGHALLSRISPDWSYTALSSARSIVYYDSLDDEFTKVTFPRLLRVLQSKPKAPSGGITWSNGYLYFAIEISRLLQRESEFLLQSLTRGFVVSDFDLSRFLSVVLNHHTWMFVAFGAVKKIVDRISMCTWRVFKRCNGDLWTFP